MRVLLVLLIILLIMIAAGIIYVRQNQDRVTITIDTEKVQQKAEEAIETGKEVGSEALRRTGRAMQKVGEKLRGGEAEPTNPPPPPPPPPSKSGERPGPGSSESRPR